MFMPHGTSATTSWSFNSIQANLRMAWNTSHQQSRAGASQAWGWLLHLPETWQAVSTAWGICTAQTSSCIFKRNFMSLSCWTTPYALKPQRQDIPIRSGALLAQHTALPLQPSLFPGAMHHCHSGTNIPSTGMSGSSQDKPIALQGTLAHICDYTDPSVFSPVFCQECDMLTFFCS